MSRASRSRVLVVDDNPAIHADFRKVLVPRDPANANLDALAAELFGVDDAGEHPLEVELDGAQQGQEALARVQAALAEGRPYQVAFVDVRMPPGWDGIETTVHLWQADPRLQVVICTAYSDTTWKEMLGRLGTTDRLLLLKKPFDTIEVAQLALALTKKWEAEEESRRHVASLEAAVAERTSGLVSANEKLRAEMVRREKAESELRMSQKLEAVGRLAAGVAHEINNPAQALVTNVEFLSDAFASFELLLDDLESVAAAAEAGGVASAERAAAAQLRRKLAVDYLRTEVPIATGQAITGVRRIARVVGALLELARPGREAKEVGDLNRAVESTLAICERRCKGAADVVLDLGPAVRAPYRAGAIEQALLALVVNALQAMEPAARQGRRGSLHIRTAIEGDWAVVEIRDTGVGIPESIRDRVFDPFFTTRDVGEGSGQGLAVARSIVVDQHGGTLALQSEVGQGTTFTLRLPLREAVAHAA